LPSLAFLFLRQRQAAAALNDNDDENDSDDDDEDSLQGTSNGAKSAAESPNICSSLSFRFLKLESDLLIRLLPHLDHAFVPLFREVQDAKIATRFHRSIFLWSTKVNKEENPSLPVHGTSQSLGGIDSCAAAYDLPAATIQLPIALGRLYKRR
jgi:hypothetical protein